MNNEIIKAIYSYIAEFATPKLDDDAIIYANQNNISLPNTDYCIFDIVDFTHHGKPLELCQPDADKITIKERTELNVRIDFYSSLQYGGTGFNALSCANALMLVTRSFLACKFLKQFNLSPVDCSAPTDTTIVRENNYLRRYSVNLSLLTTSELALDFEYFDRVQKVIKNIDVYQNLF